jgi:hypothetical protein
VFWIALFRFWPRWKRVLVIVKPDTVVRWHRKGEGRKQSFRVKLPSDSTGAG